MNKLKYYREKNGYSQNDIAKYLLITQPNYSNIETKKVNLNYDYANLLAKLYKIPVSELIEDKNGIYISRKDIETLINAYNLISSIENKIKNYE